FDLALFIEESEQGLKGAWNYSTDLFDASTIGRMTGHFQSLIDSIIAQPDTRLKKLQMLTVAEKSREESQKAKLKEVSMSRFKSIKPKAISLLQDELIVKSYLSDSMLPLMLQPKVDDLDLADWARCNREFIERELLKHGAILFRGFNLNSVA